MDVVSYRFRGAIWTSLLIASCMAACANDVVGPDTGEEVDAGATPTTGTLIATAGANYVFRGVDLRGF